MLSFFLFYLFGVLEVLLLADVEQSLFLDLIGERFEAKLGTSGCEGFDDPKDRTDTQRGQHHSHTLCLCVDYSDASADLLM